MAELDNNNTLDNTHQNDGGVQQNDGNNQRQNEEGLDKGAFGNEDLDAALGKFMGNTDAPKRPSTAGTQQQAEGQPNAGAGDDRRRDAQGRFIEGNAPQNQAKGNQQQQPQSGAQPSQAAGTQQIPAQARRFGANYWSDERGNIHDGKGQLVAPAGAGHAQFRRMYPYIESLEKEVTSTKQRIQAFEDANQLARAANLSLDDQGAALQLMVQWRKKPVETIATLLQHAESAGIDVSSIRQGGGGFDQNTARNLFKEVITEALQRFDPVVENFTQQREYNEALQAAAQEHTEFLQAFPDAEMHQDAIANVMRDKGLSAREAYLTIRAFAAEQHFDFTKPLPDQIRARQRQPQQRGGAPNGGGNNRPLPDMSGRNGGGNVNGYVPEGSRQPASADASWDSIAETTLAAFGLGRGQ